MIPFNFLSIHYGTCEVWVRSLCWLCFLGIWNARVGGMCKSFERCALEHLVMLILIYFELLIASFQMLSLQQTANLEKDAIFSLFGKWCV